MSKCHHLRITGKWEPSNANAGHMGLRHYSTLGAFVYRCDDCGEPWTGGTYETKPVMLTLTGPALTPEERAERAWQARLADQTRIDVRTDDAFDAEERGFKAGYLAALKEQPK